MTYDICRELVKRDYCYSELYGKAVRAFCRKSCGICKTGTKGLLSIIDVCWVCIIGKLCSWNLLDEE